MTDFRSSGIVPTYEELVLGEQEELEPNIIDGPYESVDHYLETHFWLLREDFVSPLRKGIQDYIQRTDGRDSEFESSYVKIYKKVKFLELLPNLNQRGRQKEGVLLCFDPDRNLRRQEENLDRSKMFMVGSLLCFTCNSFRTLLFATVTCRDHEYLSKSQVVIEFCEYYQEDVYRKNYMMIESEAFYMPYFHVLTALQELTSQDFPFQKYFIQVREEDYRPRYLNMSGNYCQITVKGQDRDFQFNVLDFNSWPSAIQLGLNVSQLSALKAALTRELAVIQGPPGTGKTFMALKITEILVRNNRAMNRTSPILVVCMTNHALDQFLVGMLKFTNKLVRIGGQSKREELEKFNFNKMTGPRHQRLQRLTQQDVIGLTTTGAARMRSELVRLGCQVVIVEEAAEVLEAHVIACLSKSCQHLIMIGDHKQLRPKTAEYDMEKLDLHVSLFERMVINRKKCCTLQVQHRMAPEISALIVPLIYRDLKNHETVYYKPTLESLVKRVSFVTHKNRESDLDSSPGKKNKYEASYVIALSKHLLKQNGYTHEDITILTTYKGQMNLIKQMIRNDNSEQAEDLADIRVAVVDDFQGEECNIILLSLVRSNPGGNIGFLATENRVCVALSRAKNGLFMIGDMNTLSSRSRIWKSIKQTLEGQSALSPNLTLRCEAHPNYQFEVQTHRDFERLAPNGGCRQLCSKSMNCGHLCKAICHLDDVHPKIDCHEPCLRICNAGLHRCRLECYVECGANCNVQVAKALSCGRHNKNLPCKKSAQGIVCQNPCNRLNRNCKMNHPCPKMCREACSLCDIQVEVVRPCGHPVVKKCHEDLKDIPGCPVVVEKQLSCGLHSISVTCETDVRYRTCTVLTQKVFPGCQHSVLVECHEQICPELCGLQLECGHNCKLQCHFAKLDETHRYYACDEACEKRNKLCRSDHRCEKKCHENCNICHIMVAVAKPCGHMFLKPCYESVASMVKCKEHCYKMLECGHTCKKKCYAECLPCNTCRLESIKTVLCFWKWKWV